MIRGPDAQTGKFLSDITRLNRRLEKAQFEITSGRRSTSSPTRRTTFPGCSKCVRTYATGQVRTNLGRGAARWTAEQRSSMPSR